MAQDLTVKSPCKRLGAILIEEDVISKGQLEEALACRQQDGGFLGKILIDLGYVNEQTLISFLVKQCKIPHINLLDYEIKTETLKSVPREFCLNNGLLPIDKLGSILTVAMIDPLDTQALEAVRQEFPDMRIKPILCSWQHYDTVLRRAYPEVVAPTEAGSMSLEGLGLSGSSQRTSKKPEPVAESGGPSAAEEFLGIVDGTIREAVNEAVASISEQLREYTGPSAEFSMTASQLVEATRKTMNEAVEEAIGTLLYQVHQALQRPDARADEISVEELADVLRSSMKSAFRDASSGMMRDIARAFANTNE